MPNQGRPAALGLPPVDEAIVPFSELFNNGFDRGAVDVTAQLADRSIFVTSNGRRFRLETIPDPGTVQTRAPDTSPISSAPAQPPPVSSPTAVAPLDLPPIAELLAPDSVPGWGRSPSNASPHSHSHSGYSVRPGQPGGPTPGAQPNTPTQEVTTMMSQLDVGRFSAAPLYRESDGGVQAAETLTDPYLAPRSPLDSTSPTSPRLSYMQPPSNPQRSSYGTLYDNSSISAPVHWSNVDYASYTAQTNVHLQNSRQTAVALSGLPSLMEDSTPIPPPPQSSHRTSDLFFAPADAISPHGTSNFVVSSLTSSSPPPHRASDPFSMLSAVSSEKELWEGGSSSNQTRGNRSGSGRGSSYHYAHLPLAVPTPSAPAPPSVAGGRHPSYGTIGGGVGNDIDTLTPVVVHQPLAPSTSSDGASTGRDNVLPGEDVLFDGPVGSAQTLNAGVFREGVLKVFRNTITKDLRFYCRVDRESETYWMKASNAQLVPAYAYDQRLSNIVYIRDTQSDKGNGYMQAAQGNGRPSGIYRFSSLKELFDFQAKLTGEKVVLDIGSVRMVTLSKANSRSSTVYSSARLQIWHEVEGRRNTQSDVASFVTAGTALSGPMRDRIVASSSRLMLYLGRLGEYITVYITDDLEVVPEGQTLVKLKPRKSSIPFSKKGSRFTWVKAHQEPNHGSEPAGLDISGKVIEADVDDYDSYKTFEIEFENSPSQDNFLRKWDEVIRERRLQRTRLAQIEDEMKRAVFTGSQARVIKT
ncbi:hypothetical protein MMYC01_202589 [Madurella mycetomatis]|uniref:Uncharacterized protein n=1 Tax=Madurella mycetomatis TaxID=100816 RepID=A0A175W5D3_9PEZI|nr:hypothetical protein MMYC01_202589 [Madurella mycetomatis]